MENIEQLKADNAKLTERLNNAAKFFREQKAQIEALKKENEELKRKPQDDYVSPEKWNALVTEKENLNKQLAEYELKLQNLESNIDSKDKAYKVLQDTYNELFEKNKQLQEQVDSCEFNAESDANNLEALNKQLDEYELKLQASEKSYEELKELHDGDLNRYNELEDNYEGLQNKYKELKEMYDNEINHFNKEQSAYENSITLLEEDNIKLGKDVHDLEAYIEKTGKEHEQVINDLKKENKEAEEQFNKILDSTELELNNVKKENDKLKNDNFELEADYQALANMHEKLQHRVDAYDNKANALESIKEIILNVFPETKKVEKQQPVRNDGFDARANNIGI